MVRTAAKQTLLIRISLWIFVGLLAYMPLHIFLSTWLGSSFGILEVTRNAKDAIMLVGFLLILGSSFKQKWFKQLIHDKLTWLILAYGTLTLVLALARPTDIDAEILGLVYNTRFLIFFLYEVVLSKSVDYLKLRKYSLAAVLGSALVVLSFGIIQYAILPNSALQHLGYTRANGVLPVFYIDEKPDLERIMSTLRDPNSLGSYVIIIASLALAILFKKPMHNKLALGFLALSLLNLWFTFSRSAWLGFILSMAVLLFMGYKSRLKPKIIKLSLVIACVACLIIFAGVAVFSNSYFVKNVIFHADESTVLEDPNELRIRFWKESINDIATDPIGSGPGTAGPASTRNNIQGKEFNENYYLQIASEVGIVGLTLFLSILALLGARLYRQRNDWLAVALFASLAGLLVTNFLVHIWSNEAVAYTWWGLAGIVLASGISHNKKFPKR